MWMMRRFSNRLVSWGLLLAMVIMPLILSAHACPILGSAHSEQVTHVEADENCEELITAYSGICLKHCEFGQQIANDPAATILVAAAAPAIAITVPIAEINVLSDATSFFSRLSAHYQPFLIFNCCLRI